MTPHDPRDQSPLTDDEVAAIVDVVRAAERAEDERWAKALTRQDRRFLKSLRIRAW